MYIFLIINYRKENIIIFDNSICFIALLIIIIYFITQFYFKKLTCEICLLCLDIYISYEYYYL